MPRWLAGLLSRVVPEDKADEVIGDLEELHGRRVARWGRFVGTAWTMVDSVGAMAGVSGRRVWDRLREGSLFGVSGVEVRLALRLLLKQPVLTLTSVVALGVGIGIAAGGASVFRQVLSSELPFPDGERWTLVETYDGETGRRTPLELERLRAFRSAAAAVEYVTGTESRTFNVLHPNGEVERVEGAYVTPGVFRYLPYRPLLGRLLDPSDGRPGTEPVALIRESLWERRFSRSADVLGKVVRLSGETVRIVGVLGDEVRFPSEGEIWVALDDDTHGAVDDRGTVGSRHIVVLAAGADPAEAQSQLTQLSDQMAEAGRGLQRQRHRVIPMVDLFSEPGVLVAASLMVAALVSVLLVIAANVANLIMARTSHRAAELSVRAALGASRGRLVSQLVVEALGLGLLAAVPALFLTWGILDLYDQVLDELPFWIHLGLDWEAATAVLALALVASAVLGVVPALRATGTKNGDLLRGAGTSGRLGVGRVGGLMILTEVALSVALLGAAVLFGQGFRAYVSPDFTLPEARVLTARIAHDVRTEDLTPGGAASVQDSVRFARAMLREEFMAIPGVQVMGTASHLPRMSPFPEPLLLEGSAQIVEAPLVYQGPDFFSALQVEPLLGRGFTDGDMEEGAVPVAVVNRSFALAHFGTPQVLGRRFRLVEQDLPPDEAPWHEIVGVVPDVMEVSGLQQAAGVYLPETAFPRYRVALLVDGEPGVLEQSLRRAAYDVDPRIGVSEVVPLSGVGAENRMALGVMTTAASALGIVTLLLSLAGVYAIVSLAVTQRTREIGVRVALGAEPASLLWAILRRSGTLVGVGGLVGAVVGLQISKLRLFAFVVPEGGPGLFAGLVGLMVVSTVLACWVPARRALSIQPVAAMRAE